MTAANHNYGNSIKRLVTTFIFLLTFQFSSGQGIPSGGSGNSEDLGEKNFKLLPIPYINYSRSVGFAIGLIPMAMYKVNKEDTISPASISGLGGIYTTNETWFAMFFQRFYLNEDNWRLTAAGGLGAINFQFFLSPIGRYVDYNTEADFLYLEGQRRIIGKFYAGLHYTYIKYSTQIGEIPRRVETTLHGIGIKTSLDKRDDVYYPRENFQFNVDWTSNPGFLGNEKTSNTIELDYDHYFSMANEKDVIALRFYSGLGIGDLSFNQQFIVGQNDIRGYTQGKYRGNYQFAMQGEYRLNFENKFGLVGFFGMATVYDSFNKEHEGLLLPGIGGGFRYNVFPEYHMNIGMDAAVGNDDWGIYFRIGEAF